MGSDVDQQQHFFEGAEKLLEIWFDVPRGHSNNTGGGLSHSLRSIPRLELERLVELAHAQIIGSFSNAKMDSYVLSESSLFVSDRRILIKTCGTTCLLNTLQPLMDMARTYAGLKHVANLNYSRRNFMRPELQPVLHQSFEDEIALLDQVFADGAGYCLGKMTGDRWYLYNYSPEHVIEQQADQTIEILMSELDNDVMNIFTKETSCSAAEARKLSGIDKLMPHGSVIDDKLFDPCGYSMNSLFADKDEYYTIHITPEAKFSYVSFETNSNRTRYVDLITKVVNTFKPGRFLITLFANKLSTEGRKGQEDLWSKTVSGFNRNDLQLLALPDSSTVLYAQFSKKHTVTS